jgi:hypothetical protein
MEDKTKEEILKEFEEKRYDVSYDFDRIKLEILLDIREVIFHNFKKNQ